MPLEKTTSTIEAGAAPLELACVIPCFNEALVLRDTIASVLAAGLRPDDVFVIDDCSSDETAAIARSLGVHVLRNTRNLGKSRSIARAVDEVRQHDRHAFLSVLDADTLVDSGYFKTVVRTFEADADVVLVCGQPRSRRHNWLTAYRAFEYALSHAIYKQAQHRLNAITVAPGCASTYRMAVLGHLEWNPEILTEDADTTVQVYRKRLGRIVYERRAIVYTQDPGTVRALHGQLRRWYTGLWQVVVCHRIPFGGQRLDAEFALVAGEALLFSVLLMLMPVLFLARPENVAYYLLLDQLLCFAVACGVAVRQRRLDVVGYAPLFLVPRLLNCFVFLATFVQVVLMRRGDATWFSPPRYIPRSCTVPALRARASLRGVARVVLASVLAGSPSALHAQQTAAAERSDPPIQFPGSTWFSSGSTSPLERGNLLTTYAVEQGFTLYRRGPHSVVPYGAVMATRDLHALDWNNKVVSQAGVRYARAFGRGIVEAGAGYALEHRFLSGRAPGQPMAFARYWFGWNPELRGRRARRAWSSLPGTSWAAVGNHAPAEGRNVIAIAHVQQGVTAATLGPAALIPFVEVTLSADSAGHPWNNRRLIGEGLKARVPVGRGVIEAAAVYKHEWRSRGGESAAALTASVGLWYGWNPSKAAREN